MAPLRTLSLVFGVLGMLKAPFGAEARGFPGGRVGDTGTMSGLGSQPVRLTAEYLGGDIGDGEGSRFGVCTHGNLCSNWNGYRNTMAEVNTWTPIHTRLWEFTPPAEYPFPNWIRYYREKQGWISLQSQPGHHSDLAARRELLPTYNFRFKFGEKRNLYGHQSVHENADEGVGLMWRSPESTHHFNGSSGRKRRAKRSCVLRRINRFLRRFHSITNTGPLGELIRAAGGLQGRLEFYRIRPNPTGVDGVGVAFRGGSANWMAAPRGETPLGADILGARGVTTDGRTEGTVTSGWNVEPDEVAANFNPRNNGLRGNSESNIARVEGYSWE